MPEPTTAGENGNTIINVFVNFIGKVTPHVMTSIRVPVLAKPRMKTLSCCKICSVFSFEPEHLYAICNAELHIKYQLI